MLINQRVSTIKYIETKSNIVLNLIKLGSPRFISHIIYYYTRPNYYTDFRLLFLVGH